MSTTAALKALPKRVNEDASVKQMNKDANRVAYNKLTVMSEYLTIAVPGLAVMVVFAASHNDGSIFEVAYMPTLLVMAVAAKVALLFLNPYTREKRLLKKSISGARQSAGKLGTELVPVLTKEHVEARIKIDDALRQKLKNKDTKWSQRDSDGIGSLLFQDLNREPIILSLISDRHLLTFADVSAALSEMESMTINPVREGWL